MGNKLGRRKQVVEEKYTKPQGLYEIKDVDYKRLRKLILDSKLAPCYPGADDHDFDSHEECPICFMYYPTLNRSRCCMKSICTECFLQMKNPSSIRPTLCPFCKTSNYAVEYRGVKSKEEKGIEQIEEQKVIEAKIRMQQQQRQEDEERQQRKDERSSFSRSSMTQNPSYDVSGVIEHMDVSPSQDSTSMQMLGQGQNNGLYRDDEFDVDLEDIMVMEAIWLSIQENGRTGQSSSTGAVSDPTTSGDFHVSQEVPATASSSSSTSSSSPYGDTACLDMLPSSSQSSRRVKKIQHNQTNTSDNSDHENILPPQVSYGRRCSRRLKNIQRMSSSDRVEREFDHGSMTPPLSTRVESDREEDGGDFFGLMPPRLPSYSHDVGFQDGLISTGMIPEGFDEQMMLAMAVSIAEAGARTPAQGVAWP